MLLSLLVSKWMMKRSRKVRSLSLVKLINALHPHTLHVFFNIDSCQLIRRHWSIRYSDGRKEVVDGEGVVGEQPTFTPGHHHQYSSCTMFDAEAYCEMEGFFLMKYLDRGGFSYCMYAI